MIPVSPDKNNDGIFLKIQNVDFSERCGNVLKRRPAGSGYKQQHCARFETNHLKYIFFRYQKPACFSFH